MKVGDYVRKKAFCSLSGGLRGDGGLSYGIIKDFSDFSHDSYSAQVKIICVASGSRYEAGDVTWQSVSELEVFYPNLEGVVKNLGETIKETIKETMTNIVDKIKLAAKGEPQKTFIKAGIMTMDERFTSEGKEAFDNFLVSKFGAEFKKEIVDPILAEEKKD